MNFHFGKFFFAREIKIREKSAAGRKIEFSSIGGKFACTTERQMKGKELRNEASLPALRVFNNIREMQSVEFGGEKQRGGGTKKENLATFPVFEENGKTVAINSN